MQPSIARAATMAAAVIMTLASYAYTITGIVTDSDGAPLPTTSLRLFAASDSSFIKGVATGVDGRFKFSDIKSGKYELEASYVSFTTKRVPVTVGKRNVNTDTIRLEESSLMLDEIKVLGIKTPVKVMEDTVEYNADSYKTPPNAKVEDLLKRLPGVEVGTDGSITANGKSVTKILVDGKEFFSDDPKVASKNLPVDMVEKLQVVDRKSDLARLTGVDDGEDETVINLTVKKNMKNGYVGNAQIGYGTDDRYAGSFVINRFKNDNQATLIGNFNNVNNEGFTDLGGSRFRRFGGTNGINTTQSLGLNFNVGNKEIFRVGGNVGYNHSDRDSRIKQERQYLFNDSSSYSSIGSATRDKGHNINASFRMQWNPDSFNTLEFRPNLSFSFNDSWSNDSTLVNAGDINRSRVSNTFNRSDADGKSFNIGGELVYNHKFRNRPGRSYSLQLRYNHSNTRENENSFSRSMFYLFNDSVDIYDQYGDYHTWSDMLQVRASWTEPLGNVKNGNFLTFAYRLQYRWNNADKMVYDHPVVYPGGDMTQTPEIDYSTLLFNDDLSNRFRNDFFNQDIRLGYKKVNSKYNFDGGLSLVPSMSKSEDLINSERNIPSRWVLNVAPFIRYRYRFSKSRSFNVHYNGRSSQPSISQLQPVADMSDPMRIVIGNPDLKPSFSHNMFLRFQDFDMKQQRSIMVLANISAAQNSIVSNTQFNSETGGQVTTYDNVNGVWSGFVRTMLSMPLRNKLWQISNNLFARYNRNIGFNNGMRNRSSDFGVFESFSIAYRPGNLDIELRPNYGFSTTDNSVNKKSNSNIHSFGGSFDATYYTPIGIVLNSELSYSGTKGYANGYDRDEWMWNASISYQMLANKSLTLSAKAYDLLQQRSNVSRSVTGNYINDSRFNTLTRYFMFSVSYNFNTFGRGNEPKSNDRRGPGEGPGHGGPQRGFGGPPRRF